MTQTLEEFKNILSWNTILNQIPGAIKLNNKKN